MSKLTPKALRRIRHQRVRDRVRGTTDRPRLCVFRSLNHIYAQVVDDSKGQTLVSASTLETEVKGELNGKAKSARAELVGTMVAKRALDKGIKQVVFDRGGYNYHGRVKALAEAARQVGLHF
ncbi:MAG: 50S ribosomal protein L18 [Dehalococcoidales bacterium]|nr:50S ribosomal protein L18 [Dehalococcoidales bacterium]